MDRVVCQGVSSLLHRDIKSDCVIECPIPVSEWGIPSILSMVLTLLNPTITDPRYTHWKLKHRALQVCAALGQSQWGSLICNSYAQELIPILANGVMEAKDVLRKTAEQVLDLVFTYEHLNNPDLKSVLPMLCRTMKNPTPDYVMECIHALASTTFVQPVSIALLSLAQPILLRGLSRQRPIAIRRKSCLITENLSKLVEGETLQHAIPFLETLLPEVTHVQDDVADAECRSVATRTRTTLERILQLSKQAALTDAVIWTHHDMESLTRVALDANQDGYNGYEDGSLEDIIQRAVTATLDYILRRRSVEEESDSDVNRIRVALTEAFEQVLSENAKLHLIERYKQMRGEKEALLREHAVAHGLDVVDLIPPCDIVCDCEFSLAYGAKILLNHAKLKLARNHRYGLCGPNGVGKSTLLRAIANHQLDGFPPADVLRTIYVEHDIDASEADTPVGVFIGSEKEATALQSPTFGFPPAMMAQSVGSLSGGWKMKLALARAILSNADIYLLDEPTNHLDVHHVAWLVQFLKEQLSHATCIIVSHDSGFLEAVCTDILHYTPNRKLAHYPGTLSKFIERIPEAKVYETLTLTPTASAATGDAFKLPEPGFLEGVKTKDKAIIKVEGASFGYSIGQPILSNITLSCCLSSRIACIGPNGAGKSTLIKGVTGEMEPLDGRGTVWRHPNVRMAYVAQHAFHHIEHHLQKTPVQYIQWRFAPGDDREAMQKASRKDAHEMVQRPPGSTVLAPDGVKRQVEKLVARRKLRRDYEYEVQWAGLPVDQTSWHTRDALEELGLTKMVNDLDMREAANQGLLTRTLTTANVQSHLLDLGLDPEVSTHTMIGSLSGGQKVKLVLGAATWLQPHLIVLDEPTNYLDRESLGALAVALRDFGGGVLVISHAKSFIDAIPCHETWHIEHGTMTLLRDGAVIRSSAASAPASASNSSAGPLGNQAEELLDAFGNVVHVNKSKQKATMSNKEKKQLAKLKKARRDRGEIVSSDEEEN